MSKKQLFTLEYPVKCSPSILYDFLSTPAGLQEWFADKVDERDNVFSFSWNGSTDRAEVMESELEKFIRLYRDLEINPEGIDTIIHLLNRLEEMQEKINNLQNRLSIYETTGSLCPAC